MNVSGLAKKGEEIVTFTVPATAGNVVYNLTVPAGFRYEVIYATITLVNDATVANRRAFAELTNGTNVLLHLPITGNATASQTRVIDFMRDIMHISGTTRDLATIPVGKCLLGPGYQFRITINAGVAGDSYSGYITVLRSPAVT